MGNFAGERFLVETFHVAFGEHLDGALHVYFDKVRNARAELISNRAIRRNGGGYGDHSVARKQLANETDAADVFVAVFLTETEAFREMSA